MISVGEVHTGLLQHSAAVSGKMITVLLDLVVGDRVRVSDRPISYAASPELLTGVDCDLPTAVGARVRGIGTVTTRVLLTGGHILQGSTYARVVKSRHSRRLPWSYYLAQPGIIEAIGKADAQQLAEGFRRPITGSDFTLDLGSISGRVLDEVQQNTDRRPPIRSSGTQLRWVAVPGEEGSALTFTIENAEFRTARFPGGDTDVPTLAELAEDIAVHDWLLTTTLEFVENARIGFNERSAVLRSLHPVIDHMLHLWMPAARLDSTLTELWAGLERRPGFSRQWNTLIARIRDQMMLATIASAGGASSLTP